MAKLRKFYTLIANLDARHYSARKPRSLQLQTIVGTTKCYGPVLDRNGQLAWAVSMGSWRLRPVSLARD